MLSTNLPLMKRSIYHPAIECSCGLHTWPTLLQSVCNDDDSSSQVYSSLIFITLPQGNVTLHVAIGPIVNLTFESRPSCGKKWHICGIGL